MDFLAQFSVFVEHIRSLPLIELITTYVQDFTLVTSQVLMVSFSLLLILHLQTSNLFHTAWMQAFPCLSSDTPLWEATGMGCSLGAHISFKQAVCNYAPGKIKIKYFSHFAFFLVVFNLFPFSSIQSMNKLNYSNFALTGF